MYLKKVTNTYKGKTREYAQIVKSMRRKDGKPSIEMVKSLGRMRTKREPQDFRRQKKQTAFQSQHGLI